MKPKTMTNLGSALVFLSDIVAIEKGEWSDERQDNKAILVAAGGARIPTTWYSKDVKALLECEWAG